jgi:citrate synthase
LSASRATTNPQAVVVAVRAICDALGAPAASATGLFAIARSAGWLAHIVERRAAGDLLRPRARHTGVVPGAATP